MASQGRARDFDTTHRLVQGNLNLLDHLEESSVHLAVTAPPAPVFSKDIRELQESSVEKYYQNFLSMMAETVGIIFQLLAPGGRLACVVEDIWLQQVSEGTPQDLAGLGIFADELECLTQTHLNPQAQCRITCILILQQLHCMAVMLNGRLVGAVLGCRVCGCD